MKVIKAGFEIVDMKDGNEILKKIERAGRVCYKSEDKITDDSAKDFVKMIAKRGHASVLEHENVTVRVICDRGVTHEIVRHRIASYSQESTRYCNYCNDKFGEEITVIEPCFWDKNDDEDADEYNSWYAACKDAEAWYFKLVNKGAKPQEARSVLPNSLKTEIVMTMNLREWKHFFKLRTATAAHPQMREVAIPMWEEFKSRIPVIFDEL